jgi:spore maturation protein CgeB
MARLVILGLSITSSWGNGHATTYRALVKALARRGHEITFLERDVPWYASERDVKRSKDCRIRLYRSLAELEHRHAALVRDADAVIVGSYVPDGIAVGQWVLQRAKGVTAFYDIDTPVTLAALERGACAYLESQLIRRYDLYLSFTGGPTLELLESMGSPRAEALYCSIDPDLHAPVRTKQRWLMGYLGTYSPDRQPPLERMLFDVARQLPQASFVVAGPQYPADTRWPENVTHIAHLPPDRHPEFYCAQHFTLNVTRSDMRMLGYSPSVRLFEAAACGVPIVSDRWEGLETIFRPGSQILVAETGDEVLALLRDTSLSRRQEIAAAARAHVLRFHSASERAARLEKLLFASATRTKLKPRSIAERASAT